LLDLTLVIPFLWATTCQSGSSNPLILLTLGVLVVAKNRQHFPLRSIALTHAVWFFDLDIFAGCSLVDVQVIVGRGEIDKTSAGRGGRNFAESPELASVAVCRECMQVHSGFTHHCMGVESNAYCSTTLHHI
jgi:hypothetical protein